MDIKKVREDWTWLTPTGEERREYAGKKSRSIIWGEYLCKCGKKLWVRRENYRIRKARSCGCYKVSRMRQIGLSTAGRGWGGGPTKIALVGNQTHYGRLMVLEVIPDNGPERKRKWICLCKCGTPIAVSAERLAYGKTKSCGCGAVDYLKREASLIEGRLQSAIANMAANDRAVNELLERFPWVSRQTWQPPPPRERAPHDDKDEARPRKKAYTAKARNG